MERFSQVEERLGHVQSDLAHKADLAYSERKHRNAKERLKRYQERLAKVETTLGAAGPLVADGEEELQAAGPVVAEGAEEVPCTARGGAGDMGQRAPSPPIAGVTADGIADLGSARSGAGAVEQRAPFQPSARGSAECTAAPGSAQGRAGDVVQGAPSL